MFLRPTYVRKNGQREACWRLVESYKDFSGSVLDDSVNEEFSWERENDVPNKNKLSEQPNFDSSKQVRRPPPGKFRVSRGRNPIRSTTQRPPRPGNAAAARFEAQAPNWAK
jgi:hypothetical protein